MAVRSPPPFGAWLPLGASEAGLGPAPAAPAALQPRWPGCPHHQRLLRWAGCPRRPLPQCPAAQAVGRQACPWWMPLHARPPAGGRARRPPPAAGGRERCQARSRSAQGRQAGLTIASRRDRRPNANTPNELRHPAAGLMVERRRRRRLNAPSLDAPSLGAATISPAQGGRAGPTDHLPGSTLLHLSRRHASARTFPAAFATIQKPIQGERGRLDAKHRSAAKRRACWAAGRIGGLCTCCQHCWRGLPCMWWGRGPRARTRLFAPHCAPGGWLQRLAPP